MNPNNISEESSVPQGTAPSGPRRRQKQRPRGNNAAQRRQDASREVIGAKVLADYRAAQDARFVGGIANLVYKVPPNTAVPKPEVNTKLIPFSTIGIGKSVSETYYRWQPMFNSANCDIFSLYRYSLMQLAYQNHVTNDIDQGSEWPNVQRGLRNLPSWVKDLAKSHQENFTYICLCIESFGVFNIGDEAYRCYLEEKPSLQFVSFQTLQSVVDWHDNHAGITQCNTLPGAIVRPNGTLANARGFWPQGYGYQQLRDDCTAVRRALDQMRGKFSKITASLSYSGKGMPSTLVCMDTYDIVPFYQQPNCATAQENYSVPVDQMARITKRYFQDVSGEPSDSRPVSPPPTRSSLTEHSGPPSTKDFKALAMFAGSKLPPDPFYIPVERILPDELQGITHWCPTIISDMDMLIGSFVCSGFTSEALMAHFSAYRFRDPCNARQRQEYLWDTTFDRLTPPENRV